MNNVTTPNTDKPLVYMDKATIDRIKDNTKELGQNATTEQVIEHLKKDNLTGNNIKDMQVGENGMIIVRHQAHRLILRSFRKNQTATPATPAAARPFSRWKSAKNRTRQTRRLWKSTTSGCR